MTVDDKPVGYVIVRQPEYNYDLTGSDPYLYKEPPHLNSLYYGGIDRMRWDDIETDYYAKRLPANIREIYKYIREADYNRAYYHGLNICTNLNIANELLEYCNREQPLNEIIAIYSMELSQLLDGIDTMPSTVWLGYDIALWGGWSLIADGIFKAPHLFPGWIDLLNPHGLFDATDKAGEFIAHYSEVAKTDKVEPYGDIIVDVFSIWRVRV